MEKEIRVALAGNPNSGKTTIFNALTGSHQKVGNWPGVTVEKKEGFFTHEGYKINVVDLPGIYSLSATSIDERIARDFLINEKPDVVVCIVDSSNLERNLYLAVELMEMGENVVIAMNMSDIAEDKGILVDEKALSSKLHTPVVKTVANKGIGLDELKDAIISAYKSSTQGQSKENTPDFSLIKYPETVENAISQISHLLENYSVKGNLRWIAIKLLEGSIYFIQYIKAHYGINEIEEFIHKLASQIEEETKEEIMVLIIEKRYEFIRNLISSCTKVTKVRRKSISEITDRVVLNRFLGIPIFLLIMFLTFKLVFTVGSPLADLVSLFFDSLGGWTTKLLESMYAPPFLTSLLVDGVINGVGSVIVFLPNILLLFFAISILEDSGYMARAAFVADKFMHSIGLHGKSVIPMILGFGCNVPAIMATRTLESEKDRILTILVIPMMSCSARLPIYVLFASVFFPGHEDPIVFSLYLIGILLAILVAKIAKTLFFKGETAPLIMELPPYRMPKLSNALREMWLRSKIFLLRAGTIIFGTVVLVWLLGSLPPGVEYASKSSYIGKLGKFIAPILKPAGFGFWQAAVALIFGLLAKEVVVGTLGTLLGSNLSSVLPNYFNSLSAFSFMLMSLIYIPCIATIAVIKREAGTRWAVIASAYSIFLGWLLATLVFQIGKLLL